MSGSGNSGKNRQGIFKPCPLVIKELFEGRKLPIPNRLIDDIDPGPIDHNDNGIKIAHSYQPITLGG
jgi:hypothetical protein